MVMGLVGWMVGTLGNGLLGSSPGALYANGLTAFVSISTILVETDIKQIRCILYNKTSLNNIHFVILFCRIEL